MHENIDFGLRSKGMPEAARRERIARQVELMGLQGYESAYPHQLSGGMQQRVAIARSYVLDPDVLLMDEPFGALDAQTRVVMQEELIKLSRVNPRTVLFITHAVEEAVYLADRVVVMTRRPGRIREIVDVAPVRKARALGPLRPHRGSDGPGVVRAPAHAHLAHAARRAAARRRDSARQPQEESHHEKARSPHSRQASRSH